MILLSRILLTGLWLWVGLQIPLSGAEGATVDSQLTLYYFAFLLLLTLPLAAVWTPYIVEGLFGQLASSLCDDHADSERLLLARWIRMAEVRGRRRWVVFLCWWEAVMVHPNLQRPFFVGMKHAKRGSWLERFFAEEVMRFGDSRHVLEAVEVLDRHGVRHRTHWSSHITEMLRFKGRKTKRAPRPMALPQAASAAAPKRNPRIKLFASADRPRSLPPAPTVEEADDRLVDPTELGPEAGQINRLGAIRVRRRR